MGQSTPTTRTAELLAELGHEIRNQLALIVGHSERCADGLLEGAQVADTMRLVYLTSRRLQSLLDVVLNLCELESTGSNPRKLPTNPAALLNAVHVDLGEVKQRVDLCLQGSLPATISTDRERLKNMIRLVLLSSLEECGPDGVRVEVSIVESTPGNAALFMDVIAVDPQHPYVSIAGVSDLGYKVATQLCQAIGGELSVLRRIGTPAEVRILLPAGSLSELKMVNAEHALPASPEMQALYPLEGARILVAEDDTDNQELIRYILDRAGAEVTLASNGQEAAELVTAAQPGSDSFDLVLMDLEMPIMNGYEAALQIREAGHELPIVAFSANSDPTAMIDLEETGMTHFVSKSIGRAGLLQALGEFLKMRPRTQA